MESNTPLIHKVYSKFSKFENTMKEMLPASPLANSEENKILAQCEKRKKFGIGKVTIAAYLLDLATQGSIKA